MHLLVALFALGASACIDLARPPDAGSVTTADTGSGNAKDAADAARDQPPPPDAAAEDADPTDDGGSRDVVADTAPEDVVDDVVATDANPTDVGNDVPATGGTRARGAACALGSECASGFCADGVCCDSACTGLCLTCTAAGSVGTCRGVPAGTDPRNDCVQQSADSCGRTGKCSANQTCTLYEAGTTCRMTSCVGNQAATSACDGAGICVTTPTQACAPFLCAAAEGCRTTCRSMADCAAPAECFGGVCGGLVGSYYPNKTFSGTAQTRVDATVDFFWYLSEPLPGFPVDAFSVRWTGKVTPRYTETYTFSVISDDGVRLWVDGQLIIDDFRSHGTLETSGTIALVAGKPVSIKLDYFEEGSESIVRLLWSSLSVSKQVIPVTALMP